MPDANRPVFAAGDQDGEFGVEENSSHVLGVAVERLDAGLGLVVPDPDGLMRREGEALPCHQSRTRGKACRPQKSSSDSSRRPCAR